jgi:hypothetical protein
MRAVWSAKSFFGIGGVETLFGVRSITVDVVLSIAGSGVTLFRSKGDNDFLNLFLSEDIVWFFVDVVFSLSASA